MTGPPIWSTLGPAKAFKCACMVWFYTLFDLLPFAMRKACSRLILGPREREKTFRTSQIPRNPAAVSRILSNSQPSSNVSKKLVCVVTTHLCSCCNNKSWSIQELVPSVRFCLNKNIYGIASRIKKDIIRRWKNGNPCYNWWHIW